MTPLVLLGVLPAYLGQGKGVREDRQRHGSLYTLTGGHLAEPCFDASPSRFTGVVRAHFSPAKLALNALGLAARAGSVRPEPPRLAGTGCEASRTHLRPLIVDWAEGDRAALEAVARRQLLVVRYEGCELEVLRGCRTKGSYEYVALTPKRHQIAMRDRNELSATLPLGAASLGGELETSGELSLYMTTVGMLESNLPGVRVDQLEGECEGATHIVSALAVGAFELSSGSSARVGANAGALGAGVAGESESTERAISKDGDLTRCHAAATAPIPRCDALLRLELLALGEHRPLCGDKERYNGESCEPLLLPVAISDEQRGALQRACKLGVKPACKAAEAVGQR